jgi:hypothetical protein
MPTRYIKNSGFSAKSQIFGIFKVQLLTESFGILSRYFSYTQTLCHIKHNITVKKELTIQNQKM